MKYIVALLIFISSSASVYAVYISEIMYDPQGSDTSREWVEIYNDTNSAIDFTTWKLFESGTNHGITSYSGGSSLQAGGYAVIADNPIKFLADFPNFQGVLYDSSFSLSNTGEQLILKDSNSNAVDTVTYVTSIGGNDDGSTLSKINGTWERGDGTPGNINQLSTSSISPVSASSTNQVTVPQMSPPSPDIVFYLPFERTVVAGADTEFSTYATSRDGKQISNLDCKWAFGDGGQGVGTSTLYRYAYPGIYVAQVEGGNFYIRGVGRTIVHVVPPDIVISKIDIGKYGAYVDIFNPNGYLVDLSQWKLTIDGASFPFPKNTVLLGKTTTRFSGVAMGFASSTVTSSTSVKVLFPNLEEVAKYVYIPKVEIVHVSTSSKISSVPVRAQLEKSTSTIQISQNKKDTRIITFIKSIFRI